MEDSIKQNNLLGSNHISVSPDHHSKNPFFGNLNESKKTKSFNKLNLNNQYINPCLLQTENIMSIFSKSCTINENDRENIRSHEISESNFIEELKTKPILPELYKKENEEIKDHKIINYIPIKGDQDEEVQREIIFEEAKEQKSEKISKINKPAKEIKKLVQQETISDDIYKMLSLDSLITDEINKYFHEMKTMPDTKMEEILSRKISLIPVTKRLSNKTLILDLDDTLVHTLDETKKYSQKDLKDAEVNIVHYYEPKKGLKIDIKFIIRPFALSFLQEISSYFEVISFTASEKPYADAIIDKIDPEKNIFDYRLYRDKCIHIKNVWLKNLGIFQNRELSKLIIVDNTISTFRDNMDNGIYIPSFRGERKDRELINLGDFLKSIIMEEDVRAKIKEKYSLSSMYKVFLKNN